ncbi:hypothetical protein CHF27_011270 [Romboutsia maritimum]|uniref:Collagen-like protein n=1 Tax=Romboutsia maritimum TaxID=2020948 RepID=A0A371IQY9_9FIRM|nr:hypothetical protein [Romboutsia maritimum]RDY22892.1 hypothetical protein CHF27_011270 [Romboutsia maritimum]
MAISRDLIISIKEDTATLNEKLFIYENDRGIDIYFKVTDYKYRFEKGNPPSVLNGLTGAYSSVTIVNPAGKEIDRGSIEIVDDKIKFTITSDLTDELDEIGTYQLQFHIMDELENQFTIPPINFDVKPRLKGEKTEAQIARVDSAKVDYATLSNEVELFEITEGKLNLVWKSGDIITANKLNAMVNSINQNAEDIKNIQLTPGAQGSQGEKGQDGKDGINGTDGKDGLTTSIKVNGVTYNHVNGLITLPDYPSEVGGTVSNKLIPNITNTPILNELFLYQSESAEFTLATSDVEKIKLTDNSFDMIGKGGKVTATVTKAGLLVIDINVAGDRYYMLNSTIAGKYESTSWKNDVKKYTYEVNIGDKIEFSAETEATGWKGSFIGEAKNELRIKLISGQYVVKLEKL